MIFNGQTATGVSQRISPEAIGLKVSRYERVAALLLALLVVVGLSVACLLVIWATNRLIVAEQAVAVVLQDVAGGSELGDLGEGMQLDSPTKQDVAAQTDLVEPDLEQTLAAVADAVASRRAELLDPARSEAPQGQGGSRSQGTGQSLALGQGEGAAGYPRYQRWEIRFADVATLDAYAAQLDHFGIELAAIGAGGEIVYASRFTDTPPARRLQSRDQEQRLYMSWREGPLGQADRQLLQRAGVSTTGKLVLQFYPREIEDQLAILEKHHAGRQAVEIRKTRFGVRPVDGGFEFFVIDQTTW